MTNAIYPWGDEPDFERASWHGKHATFSSVGCFPANDFGLHDMMGNSWEWTRSKFRPYPYRANDGREDLGDDGKSLDR